MDDAPKPPTPADADTTTTTTTAPTTGPTPRPKPPLPILPGIPTATTYAEATLVSDVLSRVPDITLATQLIATLSKYPTLRPTLHADRDRTGRPPLDRSRPFALPQELVERFPFRRSAFAVVEAFSAPSSVLAEARVWSVVGMRNAFRRDPAPAGGGGEVVGGVGANGLGVCGQLRRCGDARCTRWEASFKEYSKCSRCRRVAYCSKACQRRAWTLHKNWCLKFGDATPAAGAASSTATPSASAVAPVSAPAVVVPAAPAAPAPTAMVVDEPAPAPAPQLEVDPASGMLMVTENRAAFVGAGAWEGAAGEGTQGEGMEVEEEA
ncbi:hypothetical protein HDU96_010315 [Phlyctochytrium bullatum]|nr:hypothetical protein HDU96_010315 [Phlyctochytrium bullatum]